MNLHILQSSCSVPLRIICLGCVRDNLVKEQRDNNRKRWSGNEVSFLVEGPSAVGGLSTPAALLDSVGYLKKEARKSVKLGRAHTARWKTLVMVEREVTIIYLFSEYIYNFLEEWVENVIWMVHLWEAYTHALGYALTFFQAPLLLFVLSLY